MNTKALLCAWKMCDAEYNVDVYLTKDFEMQPDIRMRKEPLQTRSRQKLDNILQAASEVILERGLIALSIREVTRQAGVNIATFYQFFPNKTALIFALAERHREEMRGILTQVVTDESITSLEDVVATVFQQARQYYLDNPTYRELWLADHADPVLRDAFVQDARKNVEAVVELLQRWTNLTDTERTRTMALHLVLTSSQVMRWIAYSDEEESSALLAIHQQWLLSILRQEAR